MMRLTEWLKYKHCLRIYRCWELCKIKTSEKRTKEMINENKFPSGFRHSLLSISFCLVIELRFRSFHEPSCNKRNQLFLSCSIVIIFYWVKSVAIMKIELSFMLMSVKFYWNYYVNMFKFPMLLENLIKHKSLDLKKLNQM